ncbi:hypothetical protein ACFSCZ_14250 [Siminovitchia sediminis]|uniref:Uncharacterized protein n=1 Tax=Siminovitchia sediminis TaxID=1274353 RepID=A0ABW4KJL2_9BACI
MKPPLKFALYAVLYNSGDGIWEYEIYQKLKNHYHPRALSKLRSILLELHNKSWTDEVDAEVYGETIFRKYKLQERHREFVEYQLSPLNIIEELGLDQSMVEKGKVRNESIAE